MDNPTQPLKQVPQSTFNRRKFGGYIFLSIIVLATAFLTYLAKQEAYFPIDLYITREVQLIDLGWFDALMKFISWTGFQWGQLLLPIIASAAFYWRHHLRQAVMILISAWGAAVLSETVKTIISRTRPDATLIHQIGSYIRKDSFPSGHVLFFVGFYGFLLYLTYSLLKKGIYRTVLISFFSVLIFLVGVSRIYLGAHWFSDVLGAYLFGFLWLTVVITLFNRWKA